MLVGRV
jgi:hypothetical protein